MASAIAAVSVVLLPVGLAYYLDRSDYDTWGGFIWGPVTLGIAYVVARWTARRTGERSLVRFLMGAAVLKIIVGSLARYVVIYDLYDGLADAGRYDDAAADLVQPFRQGMFEELGKISGTRFVEVLNGIVQAVIGETELGSFFVFSLFGFVGMCLVYVAFCEALPNSDRRLFRMLLYLTPTMWFWPSSVGKEAFLLLCVGAVCYALARMASGRATGLIPGALGLWGVVVVRPHIGLLLLIGGCAALVPLGSLIAAGRAQRSILRRVLALALPLAALGAVPVVADSVESFFGIDELDRESARSIRDEVSRRSSQGGSEFAPPTVEGPVGLAVGLVTVTLRPFPWEAGGVTASAAALESVFLFLVGGAAIVRRLRSTAANLRERMPRFALGYVLAFAWGFSAVANFGILVRQRSLMLPLLFVLVAMGEEVQNGLPTTARDEDHPELMSA